MGNWTYPSEEKMKEIEDLLNNEMTFNLGIKMFLGEFSIFTHDFTTGTGTMYFRYSDEFRLMVVRLLSDWNDKKYCIIGDKLNSYNFETAVFFSQQPGDSIEYSDEFRDLDFFLRYCSDHDVNKVVFVSSTAVFAGVENRGRKDLK